MTDSLPQRPELSATLGGPEFARWYWTKDELAAFSRTRGLPTSGGKLVLASRIGAFLEGRAQPAAAPRPAPGRQLKEPLSARTVVPRGQRCSQILRAWFTDQLGPGFHFDAPMREFFATGDGTATLADALAHWANTRNAEPSEIAPQFELNRFTRDWHLRNPGGDREQMLRAWKRHRSLPADLRKRP
ncbi:SAP domain-containing protein [Leifsonia sp. YAF41]|uniref:SAP domain-containing protein n=1 Tax=Leifsonia sp. YAF41 TaxID=3233086 RepID=UPI003F9C86F9